jgi:hypothetical protein
MMFICTGIFYKFSSQALINYHSQRREAEMKKILVWTLLVSFINLTGCYSSELLAPRSYKFDESKYIKVITKDTSYNFKGNQYILVDDTLVGANGNFNITETTPVESSVKIPVEDMNLVEVSSFDPLTTTLVVVGTVGLFLLVVALTIDISPGISLN